MFSFLHTLRGLSRAAKRPRSSKRRSNFERLETRYAMAALELSSQYSSVNENILGGAVPFTLTRTGDLNQSLVAFLQSTDTSEITVPETVFFAEGQGSVTIDGHVLLDHLVESFWWMPRGPRNCRLVRKAK